MPTIPRESVEYVPVTVTRNGVAVTEGVSFAVTDAGARPATWTPAVILASGITAVLISGLQRGRHQVWARVTSGQEQVVEDAGVITIS